VLFEPAEIIETRNCPTESETVINTFGEHDPCLLYQGHPGRHSFELDLAGADTAGGDDLTPGTGRTPSDLASVLHGPHRPGRRRTGLVERRIETWSAVGVRLSEQGAGVIGEGPRVEGGAVGAAELGHPVLRGRWVRVVPAGVGSVEEVDVPGVLAEARVWS
jgi:hypothetical protein